MEVKAVFSSNLIMELSYSNSANTHKIKYNTLHRQFYYRKGLNGGMTSYSNTRKYKKKMKKKKRAAAITICFNYKIHSKTIYISCETYADIVICYPIACRFTTYIQKNWSIRKPEVVNIFVVTLRKFTMIL